MRYRTVVILATVILLVRTGPRPTAVGATPDAALAVIGSGTEASCLTNQARNDFSAAVAAGGTITFDCGPDPVVMPVTTSVTGKTVVVDGGDRITLSGENLRQIFLLSAGGDLTVRNIILANGNGTNGAAIGTMDPDTKITASNVTFENNDAAGTKGGAIYSQGVLLVEDSAFNTNKTTGDGGAIYNENTATATIKNSVLLGNKAKLGGAIRNSGVLVVENSEFNLNEATQFGGALLNNFGTITLRTCTFSGNKAASDGGAIFLSEGEVIVLRSLLVDNQSGAAGGGIHIDVGDATVINSTLTGNLATTGGGGIYARDTLTVTNVTFNRNRADKASALWNSTISGTVTVTVTNSIFADPRNGAGAPGSLNCDGPEVTSGGRNIVSDNSCVPDPSVVGDLLSTDAKLDPALKNNGGPTQTFMLQSGSPALDYAAGCPPVDQRGEARPSGPGCDVGAVEVQVALFVYLPYLER